MSDNPNDTWPSLGLEFRARLGFNTTEESKLVDSEEGYRKAFIDLCKDHREWDYQRLSARVRRQHAPIIVLTTAIDSAYFYEKSHAISPLIWHLITRAIEIFYKSRGKLADLIRHTDKLNSKVPTLDNKDLSRFLHEFTVQKPLVELLREYMECYLSMFTEFATDAAVLNVDRFESRILNAKAFFDQRTVDWNEAFKRAEAEENRRLLYSTSTSVPNGVPADPAAVMGTNAHFRVIGELGHGTYGEVSLVAERTSGNLFARKLIKVRNRHDVKARDEVEAQVKNEVKIMQSLRHHHIASVLFYVKDISSFSLVISPVANYDLRRFLEDECFKQDAPKDLHKHLDSWFGSLVSALCYAHEEKVIHEDIKPSNILIKDFRAYLADFGSARDWSQLATSTTNDQLTAGTPIYAAPESTGRGSRADVFALGCVFSEMLTVRQRRTLEEFRRARNPESEYLGNAFRTKLPAVRTWLSNLTGVGDLDSIPAMLRETIEKMMDPDPETRLTAKRVKRELRRADEDALFCPSC